jgi:arsenate reductase
VKPAILVLCTGNSARSQMAEGFLRFYLGHRFTIFSAGTRPGIVRPEAIAVMAELDIDISAHRSKSVNEFLHHQFAYVITVCDHARQHCPVFPSAPEHIHWSFDDPAAVIGDQPTRLAAFRAIRDQIHDRIRHFASTL